VTKTKTEVLLPAGSWRQNANFHTATFLCAPALEFLLSHAKKFDVQPLTFPRADDALGIEFSPSLRKKKSRGHRIIQTQVTRALDANLKRPIWRNFNKLVHVYTQESRLVQSRQEIITCFADVSISCRGGGRCKK
jgi:hypothetical protein